MHALAHHCGSLPKHHRVDFEDFYLTRPIDVETSNPHFAKKVVLTKVTCISRALSKGQTNFPSLCCHSAFMLLIFCGFHLFLQYICITNHGSIEMQFFFRVILKFKKLQSQQTTIFWGGYQGT